MNAAPNVDVLNHQDILQAVGGKGGFKTFLAAVKAAGLTDTLKGSGPFTLFIPSDEAFKKLPDGTLDRWFKPENKAEVGRMVTYHTISGSLPLADLMGKKFNRKSVEGAELAIDGTSGVMVNKAKVVKSEISASNGVIHVIDSVLTPPKA
jgi:uncharacterized surface protein with fasciclin (FAS1) repeats